MYRRSALHSSGGGAGLQRRLTRNRTGACGCRWPSAGTKESVWTRGAGVRSLRAPEHADRCRATQAKGAASGTPGPASGAVRRTRGASTGLRPQLVAPAVIPGRVRRRSRLGIENRIKQGLDRVGFWTLARPSTRQSDGPRRALAVGPAHASAGPSRVAVIIPSYENGAEAVRAVHSIDEDEAIEIIVVDDGSTEPAARRALQGWSGGGAVIRHGLNQGVSAARMTGLRQSAPYVFALDADDLAVGGALGRMADRLDASRARRCASATTRSSRSPSAVWRRRRPLQHTDRPGGPSPRCRDGARGRHRKRGARRGRGRAGGSGAVGQRAEGRCRSTQLSLHLRVGTR